MADVTQIVFQLIMDNFWFLYSLFLNFILLGVLFIISMRLGPFLPQILRMSVGMVRKPALTLRFTNAQMATLQVREYSPVIKVDEKEPTSELVHMNREHAFQATTLYPPKKKGGFFGLFKKPIPVEQKMDEVYTDDFIPVDINKKAITYLWGMPLFLLVEGVNSTINPMMSFSQAEQVRAASIAVEQSLLANKLIAEDKFRKELATKSEVRNWSLLNLFVLGIGLLIVAVLLMGLQQTVDTFVKFVGTQWTTFQPIIQKILGETANSPTVIVNGGS